MADDPGSEAFRLATTFYEWFGISSGELAGIAGQPTQMGVSLGDHGQKPRPPHYAERLRIEPIGTKWRIWHSSHGTNRGAVATLAQVEDEGVTRYVLLSRLPKLNALFHNTTPCEAARWVADRYNEESESLARRCLELSERYPLDHCRRAIDLAGLPEANDWLVDPAGLATKIRDWAYRVGPVAEPTQPGLPAHDVTDRQPGRLLIQEFLGNRL